MRIPIADSRGTMLTQVLAVSVLLSAAEPRMVRADTAPQRSSSAEGAVSSSFAPERTETTAVELFSAVVRDKAEVLTPLFAPAGESPPPAFGPLPPSLAPELVVTAVVQEPVAVAPIPAALPLFATGIAVLGWLARPRRRQPARDQRVLPPRPVAGR